MLREGKVGGCGLAIAIDSIGIRGIQREGGCQR